MLEYPDCSDDIDSDGLQAYNRFLDYDEAAEPLLFDIANDEEPPGAGPLANDPELADSDWDGVEFSTTQDRQLLLN